MSAKSLPALGLEREYGEKIDRCITDTLIKAGAGFLVGGVFSFALFKRRAWPVTLGTGIGLGIAYRNCEDNLRRHYVVKDEENTESLVKNAPTVQKIETDKLEPDNEQTDLETGFEEVKNLSEALISSNSSQEYSQSEDSAGD